jgi:hypothetical protein
MWNQVVLILKKKYELGKKIMKKSLKKKIGFNELEMAEKQVIQ